MSVDRRAQGVRRSPSLADYFSDNAASDAEGGSDSDSVASEGSLVRQLKEGMEGYQVPSDTDTDDDVAAKYPGLSRTHSP